LKLNQNEASASALLSVLLPFSAPRALKTWLLQTPLDFTIMSTTLHITEVHMSQITARLPDTVVSALDHAAQTLHRTRAEVIRQAIEAYLEDFGDLSVALERLQDPTDEELDWEVAKRALLSED
jgi:predicted DNA-binding protein